jgi:hypothetical protein
VWAYEGADHRPFATLDGELTVPDLRQQYRIVPLWDAASHDMVHVQLTDDGLLTAVRGRAEDQRAEIVHELARLASLLIRGAVPVPTTRGLRGQVEDVPRLLARYEFDPLDPVQQTRVREVLKARGIEFRIEKQSDCPTASSGAGCCTTCTATVPGIYYRLPIPYLLRLTPAIRYRPPNPLQAADKGDLELLDQGAEETVLLPNEAVCLYVPVSRAAFVSTYTKVTFERGMLQEVVTDKPSQLVGFVKIPIDVASAILAIPAQLLTVRIQQSTLTKDLAAERLAALESQRKSVDEQIKLLDAMGKLRAAEGE